MAEYNSEFARLAKSVGAPEGVAVGIYRAKLTTALREAVLLLPRGTTLDKVMQVVQARVHAQAASKRGAPMEIGAIGTDSGVGVASASDSIAAVGGGAFGGGGGKRSRAPHSAGSPRDRFQRMRTAVLASGVSEADFEDRLQRGVCVRCGNGGHKSSECQSGNRPNWA